MQKKRRWLLAYMSVLGAGFWVSWLPQDVNWRTFLATVRKHNKFTLLCALSSKCVFVFVEICHMFSFEFPRRLHYAILRNFLLGKIKGRAAGQNLYKKGQNCKITTSRQMNCALYSGRGSLAESVLSLFFHLWLAPSCSKLCMSSRHRPPIVNIIQWFMFRQFVKEITRSEEGYV